MINRKEIESQITDYYQDIVNEQSPNQQDVEYIWQEVLEEYGYENTSHAIYALESADGETSCKQIKKFELMEMTFLIGYMLGRVHADD